MTDCIFCRILDGELPGSFVYRDDRCAAFMDIQPVNPGHLLVVPTRHAAHLADVDGEAAANLMRVGHAAAAALRASGLPCEGVNLFLADGEAAMQEIFHVHLHVFPRFRHDGFGLKFSPEYYTRRPERSELDDIARTLASHIGRNGSQTFAGEKLVAFNATTDGARAAAFYGEVLGLPLRSDDDFAMVFDANGVELRLQKVERFTPQPFTSLGWEVRNIQQVLERLAAHDVRPERYPWMTQDTAGVWLAPSGARVAWFKDPDGNLLSVAQYPGPAVRA